MEAYNTEIYAFYVVTARPADKKERENYKQQKQKKYD